MRKNLAAMLAGTSLLAFVSPALAQNPPAAASATADDEADAQDDEGDDDEIVVTGSFIRGIAPVGAPVLGLSEEDVQASGATGTNQLLATIPQVSNMFNTLTSTGNASDVGSQGASMNINGNISIQRPTLRNLTTNTQSGASTLVLMDGHRVVGAGVNQSAPDPDVIPPGALERVEVILDGASSLYGADAVGGVINFITRSQYDGVGVDAHYGFGDSFETYDANITGGFDWGSGSAFASYNYAYKSSVFGRDQDFIRQQDYTVSPPRPFSLDCDNANISVGGQNYAVTGGVVGAAGTFNRCDSSDNQATSPEEDRSTLFGGLNQELTDWMRFSVRGYYSERDTLSDNGAVGESGGQGQVTVPTTNYYRTLLGLPAGSMQVRFNYGPVAGHSTPQNTHMQSAGISPSLSIDLPGDWQLNLLTNYGESETYYRNRGRNTAAETAALAGTTAATALNPFNIAATNPTVLNGILNSGAIWGYGEGRTTMTNHRFVFDGPTVRLPGGEVRVALGGEYLLEEYQKRSGTIAAGGEGGLSWTRYDRDVTAFFGELNIPIVGPDNNVPLVNALTVSLSARHDDYADFGETTNPRVAITYEPVDWIALRGTWGEFFNAPTVVDQANAQALNPTPIIPTFLGLFIPINPSGPAPTAAQVILLPGAAGGTIDDLQPQEATTWSAGIDVSPPIIPGLRGSLTYYNIEYRGEIGFAPFFNTPDLVANYRQFVNWQPITAAMVQEIADRSTNPADLAPYIATPSLVYAIVDARRRNLQSSRHEGIDASLNYTRDFEWGTLDLGVSGNYRLKNSFSLGPGLPFNERDLDVDTSCYSYRAFVGATIDDFYARASLSTNGGFATPVDPRIHQSEVDSFQVVDLFFRYNLGEFGMADNLAFTLNVNNALDQDPPEYRADGFTGIRNGTTLGRVFMFGINSQF